MKRNRFPSAWNEAKVRKVLEHYEEQAEEEAVAEDEAAFQLRSQTVMVVAKRLGQEITRLIEKRRSRRPARPTKPDNRLQPTARQQS